MDVTRFRGLAKLFKRTDPESLQKVTGYPLRKEAEDLLLHRNDSRVYHALTSSPKPSTLREEKYRHLAQEYVDQFDSPFAGKRPTVTWSDSFEMPAVGRDRSENKTNPVPRAFGLRSQIDYHQGLFFGATKSALADVLTNKIFPFMEQELGARYLAPIVVNPYSYQELLSLNKLAVLASRFGVQQAIQHLRKQDALASVLPTAFDFTSYARALLTFSPYSVTLSLDRGNSELHFLRDTLWSFAQIATTTIYSALQSQREPITAMTITDLFGPRQFGAYMVKKYFSETIGGINNLSNFLADPFNFASAEGVFDYETWLLTQSAVRLLFSDLIALSATDSPYLRQRMALSFLDKLANAKKRLAAACERMSETDIFKRVLSEGFAKDLARIFKSKLTAEHRALGRLLSRATQEAYQCIHQRIATDLVAEGKSEEQRLEHLRRLRNTAHGAFLAKEQFEKSFLSSAATIPPEITFVLLFLIWAFVLDPRAFLEL
jgi:hypothetical protein